MASSRAICRAISNVKCLVMSDPEEIKLPNCAKSICHGSGRSHKSLNNFSYFNLNEFVYTNMNCGQTLMKELKLASKVINLQECFCNCIICSNNIYEFFLLFSVITEMVSLGAPRNCSMFLVHR